LVLTCTLMLCCDEQPELHSLGTPDFCSRLSLHPKIHKHHHPLLAWPQICHHQHAVMLTIISSGI